MLSIVLAAVLAFHDQAATAAPQQTPRTWQADSFRWTFLPYAPGGAPGSVKLRCRVRDGGGLIGCRYSEASNHEFAAIALRNAHDSRIVMREGGPRRGDYIEFWLRTFDTNGAR